jgi:hypothetical protein
MNPLRQMFVEDMQVRDLSPLTQKSYTFSIEKLRPRPAQRRSDEIESGSSEWYGARYGNSKDHHYLA